MILSINDFGPISSAEININQINIVAGINATGKTKELKIKNKYYTILQKTITPNNIPIGKIDLEITKDYKIHYT